MTTLTEQMTEPLLQTTVIDRRRNVTAWVVVDRLVNGRAMGGIRMTSDVNLAEVAQLARKMTLKLSLAELPIGGAKAGIVGTLPDGPARDDCLRAFGEAVAPLLHGGIYLGSDQGITYRDRDLICAAAGYDIQRTPAGAILKCSWPELWRRCQNVTGHGVGEAAHMCANFLEVPIPRRVVIQGFGTVGRGVATFLAAHGYTIVGVADQLGTLRLTEGGDVAHLIAATNAQGLIDRTALPPGVTVVSPKDAWLDLDADILVLAANSNAVSGKAAERIRSRIVVEGANFPCTPDALHVLQCKGITVVPDIAANCGGAAVTALVLTGRVPPLPDVESQVSWFFDEVRARVRRNVEKVLKQLAGGSAGSRQTPTNVGH
ncbi:MAG: Glu/Leu/Phe/Val dehydrogenase dimerization domain-containing protein [Sulfurifustis sp.]